MRSSPHKAKQKESTAIHRAQKICAACGRPFSWRKKWERVWEEVRYCSDTCRRKR